MGRLAPARLLTRRRPSPFVGGNRVELLVDGGAYFRAVIESIRTARRYVYLESYIVADDETGNRVAEALIERARAGVEVAFIFDGWGSLTLTDAYVGRLSAAGVKLLCFRPVRPWANRWPWTKRNHRKSVVVDGRVALVGGMNISNDYAAVADGGRNWRDTAVRISGPAVAQLDASFREVWERNDRRPLVATSGVASYRADGVEVRFVGNEGRRDRAAIRRAYLRAIIGARRSVRIMNAYFTPDRLLIRALRKAARRGVLVELIVAGATDVELVLHASRGLYGRLLRDGVRIYEWHERILHAKTAVVDGVWATIGSANLNHRTYLLDLEVNAIVRGEEFCAEMDAQFDRDQGRCHRVDLVEWGQRPPARRLIEWFFGLFRRLI